MASAGAGPSGPVPRSMSGRQRTMGRAPTRAFTMRPDGFSGEDGVEIVELVPSSLAPIVPILRAANEIEEENPRVAYLCMCSHAASFKF
jgi:callose synthase